MFSLVGKTGNKILIFPKKLILSIAALIPHLLPYKRNRLSYTFFES